MSALGQSPPPGFDPNADRGPYLIGVCAAMIASSGVAVALRFLSRRLSRVPLKWDDWLIVLALPFSWMPSILQTYCAKHFRYGQHLMRASLSDMKNFWIFLYISEIFYPISIVLIKLSLLLFLYRIFHVRQFKIYASIIGFTALAWGIGATLVAIFSCSPISAYWNIMDPQRTCINTLHYFLGIQIPNIIIDVAIMALPLPWIFRLKITLSQKIALSGIFTLGGFVLVVGALRLNTIAVHQNSHDFTYDFVDLGVWTSLETNLGILCACFPAMRPLLHLLIHGTLMSRARSSNSSHKQHSWPRSRAQIRRPSFDEATPALPSAVTRPSNSKRKKNHTATSSFGFDQPVPLDQLGGKEARSEAYDLENLHSPEEENMMSVAMSGRPEGKRREIWERGDTWDDRAGGTDGSRGLQGRGTWI